MCPLCMTTAALVAAGSTSGAGAFGFAAVKFRWLRRLRSRTVSRPRATRLLKRVVIEEAAQPVTAAEPKSRGESIAEPKLVATHDGYELRLLSELGKWCRENGRADLATVFDDAQILERYEHG
jgi:hypothetical protein